jgi:hypothetical protein
MLLSFALHAADFYVSPQGADDNPGTLEEPFLTLSRAQQAVRETDEAINVFLRGGAYYLPAALVFTEADSGSKEAPVVYQAYEDEQPIISGGTRLDLEWTQYRGRIMQAQVPAGLATDQLFVNGKRQPMARYPNFDRRKGIFNGHAADALGPERSAKWKDPRGGFVHAMHEHMWGDLHYSITGKQADGKVLYGGEWQDHPQLGMHESYRFVENIFEELDAPGEWFLDQRTDTLYFYPPVGLDLGQATFEFVRLRQLIEFQGTKAAPVRFITLKGLTFRHTARTFGDNVLPMVRSDRLSYRAGAVFFNGTEDCGLEACFLDQMGGNAVFVNHYNRRVVLGACHIAGAGANGVVFAGDPNAARIPEFEFPEPQTYTDMDKTAGPKGKNYPANCLVEDCLINQTGRVEKQTAPIQIGLAQGITVRHCSIYDVPCMGISILNGFWGGHVIEYCDVFDTAKESGDSDHGAFNSWGRDRFSTLRELDLNDDEVWKAHKVVPLLDATTTSVLRNNRWRCDHGCDIALGEGSTNYLLCFNLCLNGGIRSCAGFYRIIENNIMINNGFHPHAWYKHSQDSVRRNIMTSDRYHASDDMPATAWGGRMDYNLVHRRRAVSPEPAKTLAQQSQRDAQSVIADAGFMDPTQGNYQVRLRSRVLALGFKNFPMDQFGVQDPKLKALARTPDIPRLKTSRSSP